MLSFVDVVRPINKSQRLVYDFLCVLFGSFFLALTAQFSIPLWFSPVPITLQTLGVMLIASLLGSKRGALAVLAYLTEGALGLPFFASGAAGIAVLAGPTGGYLFAFVLSAFAMGFLLERGGKEKYFLTLATFGMGSLCILAFGTLWLSFFVGAHQALVMGVYPFLIGCAFKVCAASALVSSGWKFLHSR